MSESLWRRFAKTTSFPELDQSVRADVAVIGGGMAGVLCARLLADQGAKAVLLEAGEIGGGVSGDTTAKITAQHVLIYRRLIDQFGMDRARMYACANAEAIGRFASLASDVDCDFRFASAVTFARDEQGARRLYDECAAAQSLGFSASLTAQTELPFAVTSALRFERQAHFHPLKFLYAAARGLNAYEHSRAVSVEDRTVITARGRVRAERIIFCTHFPFVNIPGWYFARMRQSRSYVLALRGAGRIQGMYIDCVADGFSFRPQEDLLLMGGEDHNCGEGEAGHYRRLQRAAKELYPHAETVCAWSAQDCVPLDEVPYVGAYARDKPEWLVATGFNKWGMTGSMAAAAILCDKALGRKNPYAEAFDPSRLPRSPVPANLAREAKGLAEGYIVNKAAGRPVCTHMGGSLSRNRDEDSWDCPCHGSRFDAQGRVLNGPAQRPLKRAAAARVLS